MTPIRTVGCEAAASHNGSRSDNSNSNNSNVSNVELGVTWEGSALASNHNDSVYAYESTNVLHPVKKRFHWRRSTE